MPRIISIQFSTASKLYDFNAGDIGVVAGDRVVVETERGLSIGQIMRGPLERDVELPRNWSPSSARPTSTTWQPLSATRRRKRRPTTSVCAASSSAACR